MHAAFLIFLLKPRKITDKEIKTLNLLERWAEKEYDTKIVMRELQFLMNATQNWQDLFCFDENGEKIKYCVPYNGENAYGKESGICYSEELAVEAIKFVLGQYGFLLVPWFKQEFNDSVDLCVDLNQPIAFVYNEQTKEQEEIFSTMFVFKKCANKAGFCIQNVVPLIRRKEGCGYE